MLIEETYIESIYYKVNYYTKTTFQDYFADFDILIVLFSKIATGKVV